MTRALALFLVALLAHAVAAADAVLLDGGVWPGTLVRADKNHVTWSHGDRQRRIPAVNLVSVRLRAVTPLPRLFNVYLHNGDRLRGRVKSGGGLVVVEHDGLKIERRLNEVKAVVFGRLLAGLQVKYDEVFRKELARGRDVVVVQRETRPFPVPARVLAISDTELTVRVGGKKRQLDAARVYGFVLAGDKPDDEAEEGVRLDITLADGGRLTMPLQKITEKGIESPRTAVARAQVAVIDFAGPHIAHLSAMEPISAKETALFGRAPKWRRDAMVRGGRLRLGGRSYARGLGVAAYSRLEYILGGRWHSLFLRCGIDDAAGPEGEAVFRVLADGKVVAEVTRRRGEAPAALLLDVEGVARIVLEARPGESYISDFCDWAEARVFNAAPMGE